MERRNDWSFAVSEQSKRGLQIDKSKKSERNSSVELLRIICMILIVAGHYSTHGGYDTISADTMSYSRFFIQSIGAFSRLACSVFAIITGYYMVTMQRKNHYQRIVPLIAQMVFYSVTIWGVFKATGIAAVGKIELFKALFPFFWGGWFAVYYVALYLLIPVINPFLTKASERTFRNLLIALLLEWSVIQTITLKAWDFGSFGFFTVMYLIGAYIRLYTDKWEAYPNRWNLYIAVLFAVLIIAAIAVLDVLGIWLDIPFLLKYAVLAGEYCTPLAVPCAIALFLYFTRLEIHSKAINLVAGSVFGIYLIHDNDIMRPFIWTKVFPNAEYVNFPYIHAPIKILAVFLLCLLADLLRRGTIGYLFNTMWKRICFSVTDSHKEK